MIILLGTAPVTSEDKQTEGKFIDTSPTSVILEDMLDVSVVKSGIGLNNPGSLCEDIDIIIIMDHSGSMMLDDGDGVTRLREVKDVAKDFIDELPTYGSTRVGVVSYQTYGQAKIEQHLTTNYNYAKNAIESLDPNPPHDLFDIHWRRFQ